MSCSAGAKKAARAIWKDLSGRKGIGDELDQIDPYIKVEIIKAHAEIIDKHLNTKEKAS